MSVVVDASLIIALVVTDERQLAARSTLESWIEAGTELHAPAVLPYEIANVLARLAFEEALDLADVTEIWKDLAALDLILHSFDPADDGPSVAAITRKLRRRHATDSTYIGLAQRLGTHMWTLDRALVRNANDVGLPVKLVE